jgi:hypothetical protein
VTKQILQNALFLLTISALFSSGSLFAANPIFASAAKPAVAWSSGSMKINGADHVGSANVLPGANVETLRASGQLYLADGSRLRLGAATRLQVEPSSLNLASGLARVDAVAPGQEVLPIRAGDLEIRARAGIVSRPSAGDVVVSASSSTMEVRSGQGTLLAMVQPGQTLAFAFGKATATPKATEMTGTVTEEGGKLYLTDEVTKVKVELKNVDAKLKGKRIKVNGEMASNNGAQVLQANQTAVAAKTATGIIGTKTIIGGVVVASGVLTASTIALIGEEEKPSISQ